MKNLALTAIEKGIQSYERGHIDDAVEILLESLKRLPDYKPTYYCLGDLLINEKQYKDALDVINEMPQGDGDLRVIEMIGQCKEGMGLDQEALGHADHALYMNNHSAPALNLKGLLSFKQGETASAEDYFKKAIEADPEYGEPYTNLGAIRWENEPENALNLFERGFILSPTTPDILSNYHSAIIAARKFVRAANVFEDACFLHPNCKIIRYRFIDVLLKLEKNEQAIEQIEKALVLYSVDDGILPAALKIREMLGPKEIDEQMNKRNTVSLCMIVKNEEKHLAKCLESVKPVVDEMIVVDTGSTDRTRDIAKVFGAKIYGFKWCDDFSKARNFSLSKAAGAWIFLLDADETISKLDYGAFRELVEKPFASPAAYSVETKNYTMLANRVGWFSNDGTYEAEEAGIGWTSSVKVRLFPNKPGVRFTHPVHEMVEPSLADCGISKRKCGVLVHHYGKLDEKTRNTKKEVYYHIGVKKLDELGNDLFALRELAVQAGELERYEEAIRLWQRVLSLQPDMPEAFVNKGSAYWQTGQYEDALSCAKKAISLAPNLKEAHFNCGLSLLLLGRGKEAVSTLERLILRVPEYLAAQFMLASSCCCVGKKEQSLKYITALAATKLGPGLGAAFYDLAKRFLSSGRFQYAESVIEAALESGYRDNALLALLHECRLGSEDRVTTLGLGKK